MQKLDSIRDNCVNDFIDILSKKLARHFDIEYDTYKFDNYFHLYAYHKTDFNKSFLTRSTVYEGFSIFEHFLVRSVKDFNLHDFEAFKKTLIEITPHISNPNKFHKRSIITGLIISENSLDPKLSTLVKKFFYRKNYKYCFHGWSETKIAIYSIPDKKVYLPRDNKELKKLFIDI